MAAKVSQWLSMAVDVSQWLSAAASISQWQGMLTWDMDTAPCNVTQMTERDKIVEENKKE